MYRIIEGKVYGVLTDYDVASWTKSLAGDHTKALQQTIGTLPYMAVGLLRGTDPLHLYRHDMESFFYVMVILATRYEIQAPRKGEAGGVRVVRGELPVQQWFDESSCEKLACIKEDFLLGHHLFIPSPTFEDFRGWLLELQISFNHGLLCARQRKLKAVMASRGGGAPAPFDEETLGGHVNYSALTDPARHLKGKLKGLVIRYRSQPPPLPTPTGAAQAGL